MYFCVLFSSAVKEEPVPDCFIKKKKKGDWKSDLNDWKQGDKGLKKDFTLISDTYYELLTRLY